MIGSNRLLSAFFEASVKKTLQPFATVNGSMPWDPQVRDDRMYGAVFLHGTLGLGDSYVKGWWDCAAIDEFFSRLAKAGLLEQFKHHRSMLWIKARELVFNEQRVSRAYEIAERHYNPGSQIILSFLDPYNQYTCGYWKRAADLNTAQEHKLDLICRKLDLKPTDNVLDIGGGWGGFAKFAAENYHCRVTLVTVSEEQVRYATKYCEGLPVRILKSDYRNIDEAFDKVLICGMIEHVGYKNYRTIMKVVHRSLQADGLFLLHTIGKANESVPLPDPWILKHIFPGGMLPTPQRIARAFEELFDLVDTEEFGTFYDKTLMAWAENLKANWRHGSPGWTDGEYRKWEYYLLSCAGLFRARAIYLWQFVFRKSGGPGYISVR